MEIARGHVGDRPFARFVYKLGAQRFTGDLGLQSGGQDYRTSWEGGQVIAATSPSPADSIARVALGAGLATTSLLGSFLDQARRHPDRDQLDLLAEVARLHPGQKLDLKRRLVAQRALRMFGVADAGYSVNNARSMRADAEVPPLDVRWLIYQGVRLHYSIDRLEREMGHVLSSRFRLAADAVAGLPAFGFSTLEQPALYALQRAALSATELVSQCPGLDKIKILALVYALVACDCLEPGDPAPVSRNNPLTARPAQPIPVSQLEGIVAAQAPARGSGSFRAVTASQIESHVDRPNRLARASTASSTVSAPAPDPRPRRRRRSTAATKHSRAQKISQLGFARSRVTADEVRELIAEKARLVDERANYYRLLGVSFGSGDGDVRVAYFRLAKRLHPDRLQALGIEESENDAQRVFAAINHAFAILSDRRKAAEYRQLLEADGLAAGVDDADAEQVFARLLAAEEAFRLGEMALKRNHIAEALERFEKAVELNPDEGEHHAYLAWARWCAAPNKRAVLAAVREGFAQATEASPKSPVVFLLRGHVAKQSGDLERAEKLYRKVLALQPNNIEAETELRILQNQKR